MRQYRIYTMGGVDGDFIGVRSFECLDDATAIHEAQRTLNEHSVEVRQLDRFVVRLHSRASC